MYPAPAPLMLDHLRPLSVLFVVVDGNSGAVSRRGAVGKGWVAIDE